MKRYIKSAILPLSEDYDTCSAIAHSDDTSNEFLSELSRSPYDTIRIAVAKNPNTPVSVLYQLAKDTSVAVRNAVLQNNNIPKELEMQLSPLNYRYSGRWSVTLFIAKPGGLTKADVAHYLSNTISELAETYGYTKYSDFAYDGNFGGYCYRFTIGDFKSESELIDFLVHLRSPIGLNYETRRWEQLLAE